MKIITNYIIAALFLFTPLYAASVNTNNISGNADRFESTDSIERILTENSKNSDSASLAPFGSNLFQGAFRRSLEDGMNPNYKIAPGDKVEVRIWGATTFDEVLTVDMQGNLFIPAVGPVSVGGVHNSQLNDRVTQSVRTVYTRNVNVYTSLSTAQPVAVYVAGYVKNPGHYSGVPSSSVLYFIDHAGGVDPERGSYRSIKIIRENEILETADLYEFMLEGKIGTVQFQDGDTIFVDAKARSIAVSGEIRNNNRFELAERAYSGADILKLATPTTVVTHASVIGFRLGEKFAKYMSIDQFSEFRIENGDKITLKSDLSEDMIVVEVEGEFDGQSQYVLPKNTRIKQLLNYIKVDPDESKYDSISIKRQSVAERQKSALQESLNRMESVYFTASSQTNEEASIRTQESKMISEFLKRARSVEPNGRLVLASSGSVRDVRLEMGDVITIPRKKESVMINGEVMVSQAVLWEDTLDVEQYFAKSGGLTEQANTEAFLLIKQSGEVKKGISFDIEPGDEVIVLPKVPVKNLQTASTITDILYKIAIAASVALRL